MKRAHEEYLHTVHVWRQHLSWHGSGPLTCVCEFQIGRFRKGLRVGGCGKARCYLYHGEKLLKRPTLQQRRADIASKEWLYELRTSEPVAELGLPKQDESPAAEGLTSLERGKLDRESLHTPGGSPNKPVEQTGHTTGFFPGAGVCSVWPAAHRRR